VIIQKELKSFGFFSKLFKSKQYKNIQTQEIIVEKSILEHKKLKRDYKQKVTDIEKKIHEYKSNLSSLNNKLLDIEKQVKSIKTIIKDIETQKGSIKYYLSDDNFFSKEEKELQLSSLYAKDSYLKLKAEVFKTSLQLNEVLFLKNIENFSNIILH
jgi:septal ring factor EnvC (AmiA/AmiB activator)